MASGDLRIVTQDNSTPSGGFISATASGNPTTEKVVGGGFQISGMGRDETFVINNHPSDDYGWHVTVKPPASHSVTLTSYAILRED